MKRLAFLGYRLRLDAAFRLAQEAFMRREIAFFSAAVNFRRVRRGRFADVALLVPPSTALIPAICLSISARCASNSASADFKTLLTSTAMIRPLLSSHRTPKE